MDRRVIGLVSVLLIALSLVLVPHEVRSQEIPSVVAVELDKTTVYRGYQWIEVTAYVYIPPGGSIVSLAGSANLSAGIVTFTPLARISLTAPVIKTVGNVSYEIRNLLIARIQVPFGALAGRGELLVSISLVARVGDTTYSPNYTYRFPITILDHTVVERTRAEAQVKLENARTVVSLLETVGGITFTDLRDVISNLSNAFDRADVLLYQEGDVGRALSMYESIMRDSSGVVSQAIAVFIARQREAGISLERRLLNIEGNITTANTRISALERSVESAANAIRTNEVSIRSIAQALANYSNTINQYLSTLDRSIIDTNRKIDTLSQSLSSSLNNMSTDIKARLDSFSAALSTVQLALVVVAIVMLVGFVLISFVRRR
jgi:hypothetical protein